MVFVATFWVAVINLVLLVVALALHPASLEGFHWLRELPWVWFGSEVLGALKMKPWTRVRSGLCGLLSAACC